MNKFILKNQYYQLMPSMKSVKKFIQELSSDTEKNLNLFFLIIAVLLLMPELCEAATNTASQVKGDKELSAAFINIKGLVSGTVGKIIAVVSFAFGLMASVFKFNPAAIGGSFGVALTAGLGPQMIEAVVGATF